jgi:hypothetical protein
LKIDARNGFETGRARHCETIMMAVMIFGSSCYLVILAIFSFYGYFGYYAEEFYGY